MSKQEPCRNETLTTFGNEELDTRDELAFFAACALIFLFSLAVLCGVML